MVFLKKIYILHRPIAKGRKTFEQANCLVKILHVHEKNYPARIKGQKNSIKNTHLPLKSQMVGP